MEKLLLKDIEKTMRVSDNLKDGIEPLIIKLVLSSASSARGSQNHDSSVVLKN